MTAPSVIAYILRPSDDETCLCVLDDAGTAFRYVDEQGRGFYRFPINEAALLRVGAEAVTRVATRRGIYTKTT